MSSFGHTEIECFWDTYDEERPISSKEVQLLKKMNLKFVTYTGSIRLNIIGTSGIGGLRHWPHKLMHTLKNPSELT